MKGFAIRLCFSLILLTSQAVAKDTLTIGLAQFPATFHPAIDPMLAKSYILDMARRPLTAFDAQWRLVCLMCETLPTFENGLARRETLADGKTGIALSLTLKHGWSWGDGTPVTTADIVLGWEVGRHPASGVASADLYRHITAIDVQDARHAVLHLDRLTFDYNSLGELQLLPNAVEGARFHADPTHYRDTTAYDRDPTLPGLWNGPYRLTKIEAGSHVVLERNPHWNGPRPAFDRIVVRVVESAAALEATLATGGVDMVAGELGLPLEQALAFGARHPKTFRVVTTPSLVFEHIDLNLDNPVLKDRRVRQALSLAIDRQGLCRYLFQDRQTPANGFIPPLDPVHDAALPPLAYDPALAARLLDQAGYPLTEGKRIGADGKPLSFELITTAGNRARELVAEALQAQFRALGVGLRLKLEPPRIFFGQTVTKRRFDSMAMFAWYSTPESVPRSILHSGGIVTAANGWTGENYTGYASPQMDHLIDAIEVEPDQKQRLPLWHAMEALYASDLPALPLFFRSDAHIWPVPLQGVTPTGHEDLSTLWIEDWHWEDKP